jgi:hypothetical protein
MYIVTGNAEIICRNKHINAKGIENIFKIIKLNTSKNFNLNKLKFRHYTKNTNFLSHSYAFHILTESMLRTAFLTD